MALDSDVNQADQALWVEFYEDSYQQTFISAEEGRPIYADVVKIKIRIPGNDTLEIDRPMIEDDKRRFPMHWQAFQSKVKGESLAGTPIDQLPGLTKAVVENLRSLGFHTVEQGANASDGALQLGMRIGMDGHAFRLRCQKFLGAAAEQAPITHLEKELESRDAQLATLTAQMAATQELLAKMLAEKTAPVEEVPDELQDLADPTKPAVKPKLGLSKEQAA